MAMPVKRLVTTTGRDENIMETVMFPYNEDEIATWFHVNKLEELQFAGGSASDLTVPEFNQVMQEADGRIQKIESNINAAVRFLEAKLRENPEQKKVSETADAKMNEYRDAAAGYKTRIKELEAELAKPATVETAVVEKVPDDVQQELEQLRTALKEKPVSDADTAAKAEIAVLFAAVKDSFNKMLAAMQKLEDTDLRRKYYGAAGKLADSIKNIAEAGAENA